MNRGKYDYEKLQLTQFLISANTLTWYLHDCTYKSPMCWLQFFHSFLRFLKMNRGKYDYERIATNTVLNFRKHTYMVSP